MDSATFNIHDAVFESFAFDWATGICVLHGGAIGFHPFTITWTDATSVALSREFGWGRSVHILKMREEEPGTTIIDLQSGDTVTVKAAARHIELRPTVAERYGAVAVDALRDAHLIQPNQTDAAIAIIAQEITVRRAMGDV